jgi:DNA-binding CsgD family transcriptional regulator
MSQSTKLKSLDRPTSIPVPAEIHANPLRVGNADYLILSYPLPRWTLPDVLTRSEREIVQAILDGAARAEVARERGTSPRTVSNILARAFRKLGVSSRLELAARLAVSTLP